MNTGEIIKKRLTALVAICGTVFFFVACEPRDDRPAEGPEDPGAPTYGEPDRPTPPPEDPAAPQQEEPMDQQRQQDQWEDETQTN